MTGFKPLDTPSPPAQLLSTLRVAPVIRRYQGQDIDACRALWVELTEWHRRIYGSPSIGGADPGAQFDELLFRVGPERVWVAEVEGRVVGMAGLIVDGAEAELEPIVVAEAFRGSGIGRRLAETVIGAARELGLRGVTTRPAARNSGAVRLFHGLGFQVIGQVELLLDLTEEAADRWTTGERLAGRDFKV